MFHITVNYLRAYEWKVFKTEIACNYDNAVLECSLRGSINNYKYVYYCWFVKAFIPSTVCVFLPPSLEWFLFPSTDGCLDFLLAAEELEAEADPLVETSGISWRRFLGRGVKGQWVFTRSKRERKAGIV